MAYVTENTYTGNGSTVLYSFTFPYLETTDIKVTVAEAARVQGSGSTEWTLPNATQIQFNTAPTNGQAIRIYRDTDIDNLKAEFFAGSAIRSQDLNEDFLQNLYNSQEAEADIADKWNNSSDTIDSTEAFADSNTKIMTAAAIDDRINANIASQPLANGKILAGNGSGVAAAVTPSGDVTMANTGAFTIANTSVETGMIANDAITSALIGDDQIDSEHYAADSIDTEHYAPGSVDTTAIADGTIVNADIDGSAGIAHSKLASLTDGRVLVGNGSNVPVGVTVSGDVTLANTGAVTIATGAVEHAMLATDAVDGDNIADDSIDSEHYVDGSIDRAHIADDAVGPGALGDNAVDSNHIVGGSIDRAHLSADIIDGTKIEDNAVNSEHYAAASIDNEHLADDAVGADELAANAVVNASVASGAAIDHAKLAAVSSGNVLVGNGSNQAASVAMSGDVAIAAGGATTIQANSVEIGMIGCEQTTISDSDSHIPTSGAVVDYVAAVVGPIGGLEVIADDESFPNTIPAAGVVISITDCAGLSVNSSGVSTNGDALDNSTITINGFPSELRGGVGGNADPYVFASGAGLMVVSTGSSHTYNYHQALIRESDFVQLSDDINDFNSRYRIGTKTADNSNTNDDGDLFFDTGANKMYVYDGAYNSGGTWKEVTSAGDFKFLGIKTNGQAYNGSLAFDGSATEFDLFDGSSDASINSAAQLIVVLNGVIQKPNSGSYDGNEEGFYLDGSDGIRFCDGPPNGSVCFVTQIGSAVALNEPADNTVTAAKIQSGAVGLAAMASQAVDEDNLYIDNSGSNGQFLSKQSGGTGGLLWADASVGGATGTDYNDDVKVRFGTSNELEIFHDGNDARFHNTEGSAVFRTGSNYIFYNSDASKKHAQFLLNGAVELYHNNAKKFETDSGGIKFFGNIYLDDNDEIRLGDGGDFQFFHHSATGESRIYNSNAAGLVAQSNNVKFRNQNNNELMLQATADGAVELYHNNVKTLQTETNGITVLGPEGGASQLLLYADEGDDNADKWRVTALSSGSTFKVQNYNNGSGYEDNIVCNGDGNVELYHDNLLRIATHPYGATIKAPADYQCEFHLQSDNADDNDDMWQIMAGNGGWKVLNYASGSWETNIKTLGNGAVELYHNDVKKLETASGGVTITGALSTAGHVSPTANNTYDLGDASYRWRNVYTADLQMSNEGSANEVDGTWGNYTIQEGEDDLFLINRRNGKKYKFNLTEVN